MGENVQVVYHKRKQEDGFQNRFGRDAAKTARRFHESIPGYAVTPLAELPELSKRLGVAGIYVKDESKRFGLNAFKGLGGSYCIGRYIGERLGIAPEELSYERITGDEVKEQLGTITFVTATDGNHGRGIAWTAQMLGQKAVVFMPKGSSQERLEHIRHLGAQASITDWNYDRTLRSVRRPMAGSLSRTRPGKVMKPFPDGSWRDILRWRRKQWSSWDRSSLPMYSFRQE